VDDYIEALGYSGTVEDIHVVCTKLVTPDNKVVYLPNGALSAGNIVNYSEKEQRRVDIDMTLASGEDIDRVRELLLRLCSECSGVLLSPEPTFRVLGQERDGISVSLRMWVRGADYWTVKFEMTEQIKKSFSEANIKVPHKQLDVHLKE
jgi:small conductance mechanosensitive channel